MVTFQKESSALLDATLEKDGMEVAKGIEKIHTGYSSTIMYHDEIRSAVYLRSHT
mgnify:CR=1 FL=1